MAVENQLQFAAVLVPILGIVVVSAADTVDEDDTAWYGWYRPFVASVSIVMIGPLAVASLLGIFSVGYEVSTFTLLVHAGIALVLAFVLIFGVTIRETTRGLSEGKDVFRYVAGLLVVIVLYGILFKIAP